MQQAVPNIEELFFAALELESSEARSAFLDRVCGDTELRRRVERLLALDAEANDYLESPAPTPTMTAAHDACPGVEESGTAIGPYKLLEPIGEGGMGTVYVAEQTEPVRRRVALKVIKPGMDSKQVVARFEAERQALAMMDHPNIAKVLDGGMTPASRPYFVMELVRGLPITEYCDQHQLSIPERLELFVLVCQAVQHAHQKGVIHRDLKPSNVLVTVVDGVPTPRVIDFGVAKATGRALTDKTVFTGFHQFVGTPLYVSPEQAELSGADVDTRSDIYSLGVLLYELLTGTTPFDSETLRRAAFDEMRRIIREEEPQRPSTRLSTLGDRLSTVSARRKADPRRLGTTIKGELDWVVMKALEKDRRRRYETANDFAADVMNYLSDRPVGACPPSTWYRLEKYSRRNRALLAAGTAVGLAPAAGTAVSIWQAVRAVRAERRAEARSSEARQAVDEMYTQVAERWLSNRASLTALQREFLEKALAFYQKFAAEEGSDPEVRYEAARTLYRVGKIQTKLGRHAEAAATLREVVARGTDLARRDPGRPEALLLLADARVRRAYVVLHTGWEEEREAVVKLEGGGMTHAPVDAEARRTEVGRELLQAGRELAQVRAARPGTPDVRRRLAETYQLLCDVQTRVHQSPEAGAAVRSAIEVWESLVKDDPTEFDDRAGLARAHAARGMHHVWWGRGNEEAEAALRQADTLLSELLKQRPAEVRVRDSLSGALTNLGMVLARARRFAEEEAVERRCLTLADGLASEFPEVPDYQLSLAICLHNLARTIAHAGRPADPERQALCARAVGIGQRLVDGHPGVAEYHFQWTDDLEELALAFRALDQPEEARRVTEQALALTKEFAESQPGLIGARTRRANTLLLLTEILVRLGDLDAAGRAGEEWARLVLRDLPEQDRGPDRLGRIVLESTEVMVRAAQDGEGVEAIATPSWREAGTQGILLRARSLVSEAGRLAGDDAVALRLLADVLTMAPEGMRDPRLALSWAEKAVSLKPGDGMALQSLGWAQYRAEDWNGCIRTLSELKNDGCTGFFLAMAHWRLGKPGKAREEYRRADERLTAYERHWDGKAYPPPSMLRVLRDEATALLGPFEDDSGPRAAAGRPPQPQ